MLKISKVVSLVEVQDEKLDLGVLYKVKNFPVINIVGLFKNPQDNNKKLLVFSRFLYKNMKNIVVYLTCFPGIIISKFQG